MYLLRLLTVPLEYELTDHADVRVVLVGLVDTGEFHQKCQLLIGG